jgi:hypothetical protein
MAKRIFLYPFAVSGGKVKNVRNLCLLGGSVLLGATMLLTGCKSTPELAKADALALIQAKYDQTPAVGANVLLNKQGVGQGITAKYWQLSRVYPNRYWADYTLTPDGKKALKLLAGGDVIQWRPSSADDANYTVAVVTVAANHLKAKDIQDISDETVPGVATAKGASFTEVVNLEGVPDALQEIAHNPGNKLSTKRQADFSLENGAWTLHSIE